MKQNKKFDCVEMKREIQSKINEERKRMGDKYKNLDREELPKEMIDFINSIPRIGEKVGKEIA